MATKRGQDFVAVINGLQKVAESAAKQEWKMVDGSMKSSSMKNLPRQMSLQPELVRSAINVPCPKLADWCLN